MTPFLQAAQSLQRKMPETKVSGILLLALLEQLQAGCWLLRSADYFFLRATKPAASDPSPTNPRRGSGEAVCGNLEPAFWS